MKNKVLIMIMTLLLIVTVILGIITRKSYKDDISQKKYMGDDSIIVADSNVVYVPLTMKYSKYNLNGSNDLAIPE